MIDAHMKKARVFSFLCNEMIDHHFTSLPAVVN